MTGKTYYTSVENPFEALRSVSAEREFNTIGNNGQLANELQLSKGKIVFVNFEENNSAERGAALELHGK